MRVNRNTHAQRLSHLRRRLKDLKLDALAVVHLPNVRYLTGFTGSAGAVLVDRRSAVFITDFRYLIQAGKQVLACRTIEQKGGLAEAIAETAVRRKVERLGFEPRHTSWSFHGALRRRLGKTRLIAAESVVEGLRITKDSGEVAAIGKAVAASRRAFNGACRNMAGKKERNVAVAMERIMVESGAESAAFPTIVASGSRGALPHAVPGRGLIRQGKLTVVDFGARADGYNSDTTRTIVTGKVPKRAREIYRIVAEAQRAALETIRPGVRASEVDRAARDIIRGAGYGECFGHGTGHGVGLEVHESPTISPKSGEKISRGMVFTVEPGIYLKDFGGVRIEDMVLVTAEGCEILTRSIPRHDL